LRPFVRAAISAPADTSASQRQKRPHALPYRVGHGFDLHRLEEGPYKLILGGLEIPHDRGCVAHSDGALRLQSQCRIVVRLFLYNRVQACRDVVTSFVTDSISCSVHR
jgi:hypothetical protein